MGSVIGKITEETPKYEVAEKGPDFEVREYAPCVAAEVTYVGDHFQRGGPKREGLDGGFMTLAGYIGAVGKANNEKAAGGSEKIAMTAPVVTSEQPAGTGSEKIAMTAPVITAESTSGMEMQTTMQFILPSKYTADSAPKPLDSRVSIRAIPARRMGVTTFSGNPEGLLQEKVTALRSALEAKGYKIAGDYVLARYNPPWTLWFLKTNEIMFPLAGSQSSS